MKITETTNNGFQPISLKVEIESLEELAGLFVLLDSAHVTDIKDNYIEDASLVEEEKKFFSKIELQNPYLLRGILRQKIDLYINSHYENN